MAKTLIIALIFAFFTTLVSGAFVIPILRKLHAGQTILEYVEEHKDKNGMPTMGGLFFVISAAIVFLLMKGFDGKIAVVSLSIGLAFMIVGFLDDFIKIKFRKNQGLKAYQKIIFQLAISFFAGVFCYVNGITVFHLPFTRESVSLGWWTIPFVAIIFIAITNSVNLVDGLDGLAGSISVVYLVMITILISVQTHALKNMYLMPEEYEKLSLLSTCLVGAILGFLVYNVPNAKVFMGDTGSLSLGGFIGSISIFSSNSFFIPIIGITFVVTSISVIIQVLYYKKTKKRVFLKAPLHHHFQLKGWSETRVGFCYSLTTLIFGALVILSYL